MFFSWWVVRCWGSLLPAGRNVRVSMMVECFGRYMFFRMCLGVGYLCLGTYFCFGAGVFCSSVLFAGWSSCGYYAVVGLWHYIPL